jgi:hypothetical protein
MRSLIALPLLILSIAASPVSRAADEPSQKISVPLTDPSRPATVKVSSVTGGITVEGYGGREVVVEASARADEDRRKPPHGAEGMRRIPNAEMGLTAEEENNVVRIETRPPRGGDLRVQVPFHTNLHVSSVNGGRIRVTGVEGEIELSHVNGGIEARDLAGSVVAHTTNGDVKVVLRRVDAGKPMAFSTLNGDVDVTFPADLKADVRARSDRGDIYSDFEIATRGRAIPKETRKEGKRRIEVEQEMLGTINGGGPELLLKTFNGDILIHRGHG